MQDKTAQPKKGNFLIALFGPAGSGKSTIARELAKRLPWLNPVVTYSTRSPRPGEQSGLDYNFITKKQFLEMQQANQFFEWVYFSDSFYATPIDLIKQVQTKSFIVSLELDGIIRARKEIGSRLLAIKILPPSPEKLKARLMRRGDSQNISTGTREASDAEQQGRANLFQFNLTITNESLNESLDQIEAIIGDYEPN